MEYLVLMATAVYYRAFYETSIFPKWELACEDPIEAVLVAADKYNVRFFMEAVFMEIGKAIKLSLARSRRSEDSNRWKKSPAAMAIIRAFTDGIGLMRRVSIRVIHRSS